MNKDNKKTALITGGTKGIGFAVCEKLLQKNYFLIITYASDDSVADNAKVELSKCCDDFLILKQPLNTQQDAINLYEKCKEYKFDLLVFNAGCTNRTKWKDLTWEQWNYVMNVNVNVPGEIIRKFDPLLQDNGNIIMISSDMSVYPHAVSVPYTVSKSAVNGLTLALVKEYCERNIRVNAILPGFVNTSWQKNKPEDQRKRICDKIALHRFAEPEEIAEVVFSVINSSYINGSLIKVDGGYCYR